MTIKPVLHKSWCTSWVNMNSSSCNCGWADARLFDKDVEIRELRASIAPATKTYICPMCFTIIVTIDNFPRHCEHYMIEHDLWNADIPGWLGAKEYELQKLRRNKLEEE